jgi:hypothetical protein
MEIQRPQNMTELLNTIRAEWSALMKVVSMLTPEQMETPDAGGWSPKDNLSHISHWERYMLLHYLEKKPESEAMGFDAEILKGMDENGENALIFERNRNWSLEDVLKGLEEVHAQVISTLKDIPFSRLMEPVFDDDPQKRPTLVFVIGNTSEHYAEHRATIEKVLKA